MGAWGYGIVQNDTAQDGMCAVAGEVEQHIAGLPDAPSEGHAAELGAAVGLLLHFSHYSFNPENPFHQTLLDKLRAYEGEFDKLPGNAGEILAAVLAGQGAELNDREGPIHKDVEVAMHGAGRSTFMMQKVFSVAEPELFAHPDARAYIQRLIDGIVAEVEATFEDDDLVGDLSREADAVGPTALLLVVPAGQVDPERFVRWRARYRAVIEAMGESGDQTEDTFQHEYGKCLELAFRCGIDRFSPG